VPTISPERLVSLLEAEAEYLYIALRRGITGEETRIAAETVAFLDRCAAGGAKLFAGFGIRNPEQIELLSPYVEAAVVGSALVEVIAQSTGGTADDIYRDINRETRRLCGV
jgi:tryptophan synthase alpha chain